MPHQSRYKQAKKVTLIGALVNAFLGVIKLLGGLCFHSHALVADGLHSFSDLLTDATVLFASKYGSQDADDMHPYGHQRIETAATLLLAMLLILAGAGIAWDSLDEIIHKKHDTPSMLALPIAAVSILANEWLFYYTRRVGTRIQSNLLIANAWHHRSDAAASFIVVLGLVGSIAGFRFLDPLAATVIGCMIIKMGIDYGKNCVMELVDTAVDQATLTEIERIISQVDGVQKIHQLRSRMMGQDIFIDVHILVSPFISVSEGHYIAQHVHHALINTLDKVKDVTVHVDPEDDEVTCPSMHLPSRTGIEQSLLLSLQTRYPAVRSWVVHYLDGELIIDLVVDDAFTQWQVLEHDIEHDLAKHPNISRIHLFCHKKTLAKGSNNA